MWNARSPRKRSNQTYGPVQADTGGKKSDFLIFRLKGAHFLNNQQT